MNKLQCNYSKTLRFRRWSRKSYALFVSVLNVVSIGVLAVSVGDKSIVKSKFINSEHVKDEFAVDNESEFEDNVAEKFELNQELYLCVETAGKKSAACIYSILKIV